MAFSTTINGVKNKEFAITDLDGKPVLWLSGDVTNKKKWFILDAASGLPLLSIIKKVACMHACLFFKSLLCIFSWNVKSLYIYIALYRLGVFITVGKYSKERTRMKSITYLQSERVQISKFIKSGTCFFLPTLRK